jgi:argininosuccinate lyase
MTKLWQKQWILNKQVETFETGGDLLLDQKLVWADVAGSLAHAMMLAKIGILTKKELQDATKGLLAIQKLAKSGKCILKNGDEDIHTKIENYLTETCGSVGEKIHTGRSRNDQVLTAIRLCTKNELINIWITAVDLACAFVNVAKQYECVPMPGYTHMQKAMPSSVGMWAGAFAESLIDDIVLLKTSLALIDQSPLGSAAGYGVPLPLDRAYTTKLLGFGHTQNNSLYCQNSRGKFESSVVASSLFAGSQ